MQTRPNNKPALILLRIIVGLMMLLGTLIPLPQDTVYAVGGVIYVKANATGANNGSSWTNAYTSLQAALAAAGNGDQIWVASGTYYPTSGSNRSDTFSLKNGVAIYGGFAGTETLVMQRDPQVNVTILSGDIGASNQTKDNSYHVVVASGTNSSAVLDGFTIMRGNADLLGGTQQFGGGMYSLGGSPTLSQLVFRENKANYGAGFYNDAGSPTLTNITFTGNSASRGAGMYNINISNPILTNVTFSGNIATNRGGGMSNAGSNPVLTNVTFSGNSARLGGGMQNVFGSNPTLINVTFSSNTATTSGGAIYNTESSNPTIINSILYGNPGGEIFNENNSTPVVTYSIVQGGYLGTGNLNADPQLHALTNNGGPTQTRALGVGSPAIDAGNNASCPVTDQRGVARPQGSHCDIGAYEDEFGSMIHYVKWDATGTNNGFSWANAYTSLQSALTVASSGDEIWVAAGTYKPTIDTDRTSSFSLKNGVAIYGGFAGTETLHTQRDPALHITILSGDIGAENDTSDNSYHVVIGDGTQNTTILDGFTIMAGNANGLTPNDQGGGMYNSSGYLTLTNLIFSNNSAFHGGGIYNAGSLSLVNVTFNGNSATYGGGIYNWNGSLNLRNVTFTGNAAIEGGGVHNNDTDATFTNVTFSGNTASTTGGAMYNSYCGSCEKPLIMNSILYGDIGGEIYDVSGQTVVTDSIVQGGFTGTGNLDTDPLLRALAGNGGFTQTMALSPASPAINAGNDADCPGTDQRGMVRPQGNHCDIGAYEYRRFQTCRLNTGHGVLLSDCLLLESQAAVTSHRQCIAPRPPLPVTKWQCSY
jgi:predicted outer membrane repeat protein